MADINKFFGSNTAELSLTAREHLAGLEPWDETIAQQAAQAEGIVLTQAHWEVINLLRQQYLEHGPSRHARDLSERLDAAFDHAGGLKYLYRLFPHGPVIQACRIAGLPVPADASDRSFGSVH